MTAQLTEEQRRRIADILQKEPPREFLDPEFHAAYEAVQAADRELALAWLDSLGASDEEPKSKSTSGPLPAEEGALRARWAARRQRAMRAATTSRVAESDSPRAFIPDSRRIVGTVMFALLALAVAVIAWTVWRGTQETPVVGATPAAVVEEQPDGPPVVVIDPPASEPTVQAPPVAAAPVVEPPPPLTFTSETPAPITPAPVGAPGTLPAPAGVPEVEAPRATSVFAEAQASERSTVLHQVGDLGTGGIVGGDAAGSARAPGLALVSSTPAASVVFGAPEPTNATTGGVVFGESTPANAATGGVVFSGAPTGGVTGTTVVHVADTAASAVVGFALDVADGAHAALSGTSSTDVPATMDPSSTAVPPLTFDDAPAPGFALALEGAAQDDRTAPATPAGVSANAAPATPASWNADTRSWGADAAVNLPPELQVGARIPARLVTSATIVAGAPAPVIAETFGQWCGRNDCPSFTFIGRAELVGGNRVIMNFDQAVTDSGVFSIAAVALSEERSTSIPAVVRDETPTLAPDLVRASLGGVTQWATSLMGQTRTTTSNGTAVQESVVPPLEALIAGSLAQALQLPSTNTTVVRLAEIDPGTPVVLAIGVTY